MRIRRWLLRSLTREETFTCPTCGTEISEFDEEKRDRVIDASFGFDTPPNNTWYWYNGQLVQPYSGNTAG